CIPCDINICSVPSARSYCLTGCQTPLASQCCFLTGQTSLAGRCCLASSCATLAGCYCLACSCASLAAYRGSASSIAGELGTGHIRLNPASFIVWVGLICIHVERMTNEGESTCWQKWCNDNARTPKDQALAWW